MQRFSLWFLILMLMCLLFGACGTEAGKDGAVTVVPGTQGPTVGTPGMATPSMKPTVTPSIKPTVTPSTMPPVATSTPRPTPIYVDRTGARELVSRLTIGFNMGNSLDSHGASTPMKNETHWGNPATTKEMLQAIYDRGFDSIRIPVTWAQSMASTPDATILEEFLARVETVVRDALDIGFYVILDSHHDTNYWLIPRTAGLQAVEERLSALWRQLALRFADCDEHLIFEGMNEPRIRFSNEEWRGGTADQREAVNILNAAFIKAVRETGGNNATRLLVICPYGNSVTKTSMGDLVIPPDPWIAVAVHLYTPSLFSFDSEKGFATWTGNTRHDIVGHMEMVNRYLSEYGIPVLITEMGAVTKKITDEDGTTRWNLAERQRWLTDYFTEANKYGYKCFWWDNDNFDRSGERFGIFDRKKLTWYEPELIDTLMELANNKSIDEDN